MAIKDVGTWAEGKVTRVPMGSVVDNPFQVRHIYKGIEELAKSIGQIGLLQIPTGRIHNGVVELGTGSRRRRALELLGWTEIPVRMHAYTDEEMAALCWHENMQRNKLTPMEQALAINQMVERFGWTHKRVATLWGLRRSTISNKLRLLRLDPVSKTRLESGEISEREALRTIVKKPDVKKPKLTKKQNPHPRSSAFLEQEIEMLISDMERLYPRLDSEARLAWVQSLRWARKTLGKILSNRE